MLPFDTLVVQVRLAQAHPSTRAATHAGGPSHLWSPLKKPAFQSLPKGTKIFTPTRRLAKVMEIDASGRVHVEYLNARVAGHAEQGCFPLYLVKADDICNTKNTQVQHTCGHGDKYAEARDFWASNTGLRSDRTPFSMRGSRVPIVPNSDKADDERS